MGDSDHPPTAASQYIQLQTMFDEVVEENSALASQLEVTTLALRQSKESATESTNNFAALQQAHERLLREHEGVCAEKAEIETEYQEKLNQWEEEIDLRRQEFDTINEQLLHPGEIEALKAQVAEEALGPARDALVNAENTVESYRQQYSNLRNDHESLRTEYEVAINNFNNEVENLKAMHNDEVNSFKTQISSLREKLEELSNTKTTDLLRQEVAHIASMLKESRDRAENLELEVARQKQINDQDNALAERRLREERALSQEVKEEKDSFRQKLEMLRIANETLREDARGNDEEVEGLHRQLEASQATLASLKLQSLEERETLELEVRKARRFVSEEHHESEQRVIELDREMGFMRDKLAKMIVAAAKDRKQMKKKLEEAKLKFKAAKAEMECKCEQLEGAKITAELERSRTQSELYRLLREREASPVTRE